VARTRKRRIAGAAILFIAIVVTVIRFARTPSNDRQWHPQQERMPQVQVRGNVVEIRNVRDFVYRSESDFERRYIDRTYDLRELDSADYVVSRFGGVPGLAHAFLTFRFGDEYVAISVEARKERGESYSPFKGLLNAYELMYVIGTERDLIGVRTHVWKEDVTLYRIKAGAANLREVFLAMTRRADALSREPEHYDTLLNSCNSNIVAHVNEIAPGTLGLDPRLILPGSADRVGYAHGLIDSKLPLERVGERVPLDEHFSAAIRRAR
jgi:hypothetical protein